MNKGIQGRCPNSQPTSIISLEKFGDPRRLKFVGVKKDDSSTDESATEFQSFLKLIRILSRTNVISSGFLFISVAVSAACLCRPVSILGGLLVSMLLLGQGVLGHHVSSLSTRSLMAGYSCLSGFVATLSLGAAFYLFSGQFVLACMSPFHTNTHDSAIRLHIVELTALIATIPLLLGSVGSLVSSVLASTQSRKPKKPEEPQLFLYLQDNFRNDMEGSTIIRNQTNQTQATVSTQQKLPVHSGHRPPPTYQQAKDESYA